MEKKESKTKDLSTIIVATENDYDEIVSKTLLSPFTNFNPFRRNFNLYGGVRRVAFLSLKSNVKTLPAEEKGRQLFKAFLGPEYQIPRFSPEEARELFRFDSGLIPRSGAVYFQHPYDQQKYLLPSTFNVTLAREKVFVFNQLAGALGAKKITLRSGVVRSKKWNGKALTPIPEAAAEVGLSANFNANTNEKTHIYAEFDRPKTVPYVPVNLALWAKSDPLFETMVHSRLGNRLRIQNVTLELKEQSGFGSSMIGKYRDMGFDIGGKFSGFTHSIWECEVEYWPTK